MKLPVKASRQSQLVSPEAVTEAWIPSCLLLLWWEWQGQRKVLVIPYKALYCDLTDHLPVQMSERT